MTKKLGMLAAALAISPWMIAAAPAAPLLYGTLGGGGTTSTLVQIDATTGAITSIGSVGYTVNGLAWDASTNTLYGSARDDAGLLTINTTTGAGTLVAGGFNSAASGCTSRNVLLAASSAGVLFGWCDPSSDDLMSIDKVTGIATLVGESGVGTATHGLAFDNNDDLYMHNAGGGYYSIDTVTGAATFLGTSGANAHHGDFNPDTNYYYGLGFPDGKINIVDIVGGTGLLATIDTGNGTLHTLAFVSPSAAVPEPASLALVGLGLAGLGFSSRKKA